LEALMKDSEISDILVNNCGSVYIERHGKLEETDVLSRRRSSDADYRTHRHASRPARR
jgi:Flp pilus assembly CpaF family ATPase